MPKQRSTAREEAKRLWLKSKKTRRLKDIAEDVGVSPSQIYKWKCVDNWDDTALPKRGAPNGNRNGKGAPHGNKRSVSSGSCETITEADWTEEERLMVGCINTLDLSAVLNTQITTLLIRERRMLKRISDLRKGEAMVTRTTSTKMEPSGKKLPDGKEQTCVTEICHNAEAQDDRVIRIEDALTRVQAELRRCVDSLRQVEEVEAELAGKNGTGTLADAIMAAYNARKSD